MILQKAMKKIISYLTAAIAIPFLLYSTSPAFAQSSSQRSIKTESALEKNVDGKNNMYSKQNTNFPVLDIVIDENLPHYLQGVRKIPNTVKDYQLHRWMESWRVHSFSTLDHQKINLNFINQAPSFTEKIHGKDVRFILQDYMIANKIKEGENKKVLFYHGAGGTKELPMEEYEKIRKDLVYRIAESATRNAEQFGGIFGEVKSKLAKRFGMEEKDFEKEAEESIILRGGIKAKKGELIHYPGKDLEAKDFVMDTIIFGNVLPSEKRGSYIHAAVYTNTGIMFLTPLAVKLGHIDDSYSTIRHEMIHANKKMQNFVLNNMMDVELFASFPWLDETMSRNIFHEHSYLEPLRWTIKTYMCFDINQATRKIISGLSNTIALRTDEDTLQEFRKYGKWIDTAKKTLKKATRKALVEFYSDPAWFGALNEEMNYDGGSFDVLMSQQLEPTCLGGPEKTLEWITKNKGKINDLWDKSIEEMKKENTKKETNEMKNNPQLKRIFTDFNVIRNNFGQGAAETYLMKNIDEVIPFIKDLSEKNLQQLKNYLKTKDINTQRGILEKIEINSLETKINQLR